MTNKKEAKTRPINASGFDKSGNLCRWTGFDKQSGQFFGIPIRQEPKNKPQSSFPALSGPGQPPKTA